MLALAAALALLVGVLAGGHVAAGAAAGLLGLLLVGLIWWRPILGVLVCSWRWSPPCPSASSPSRSPARS